MSVAAMEQLDVSQLQAQVRDLTQPLSLRPASPVKRGPMWDTVSSSSPDVDVDVVLTRIQEMERRHNIFEAVFGGEEVVEKDLQEVRTKRFLLEDKQIALEEELKDLRRKLQLDTSGPVPVHANKGNQPSSRCESGQNSVAQSEKMRSALMYKGRELKTLKTKLKENETLVAAQKEQLSSLADQLFDAKAALDAERIQASHSRQTRQSGPDSNLAQREVAVLRRTHELERARSQQQAEQQSLQAERSALQKMRRELERERQDLERKVQTVQPQAQWGTRQAQIRVQERELDAERRWLEEKRRELEAEQRLMETQRHELTEAYNGLENLSANRDRSWWDSFCGCCTQIFG